MTTHDFTFAWEHADAPDGPWAHLQVVRFHGREELSTLSRHELTLLAKAPAPEVDPHALIGARATLRIATLARPATKRIHGIIVEAEELTQLPDGMLYRVLLMPPLVRARHRTRSRIFLEKTTRQIIEAVLLGDLNLSLQNGATVDDDDDDNNNDDPAAPSLSAPTFTPAREKFCWRLTDLSRIDDRRVRPYCVQYNESDLAFVSRLLEEDGLTYHVENGASLCLLVLSDSDQGKPRLDASTPRPSAPRHAKPTDLALHTIRLGARLREKAVRLRDYDWRKPALDLLSETHRAPADLFEDHFPGRFSDAPTQGAPLARARLDRHHVESEYATFEARCRALSTGSIFRLDHAHSRYDGEYLVTKLDTRGEQPGVASVASMQGALPFTCSFECARRGHGIATEESRFRPPRTTPKPRILGSQTAFVTADPSAEGAEIQVGGPPGSEIGCVRLRFHWDHEQARLSREPSSCWVRVSQVFAGAGEGALFHPRVGVEVIVEFLDGDPDRPIITGRVYNGKNRPPAAAAGAATVSVFKSCASPGAGVHNELGFDDTAGQEQINMHAGKDWNSTIGHDRSEMVANDSASHVRVNRAESTGGSRTTSVEGDNAESVGGNERLSVGGNQSSSVGVDQSLTVTANRTLAVGANQSLTVAAARSAAIGANDSLSVGGNRAVTVAGNLSTSIGGNTEQGIGGNRSLTVSGTSAEVVAGSRRITVSGALTHAVAGEVALSGTADIRQVAGANFAITTGANLSLIAAATAVLQAATIHVNGAGEITLSAGGGSIKLGGGGVEISGGSIKIAGGSVAITGTPVKIN